MESLPFTNDLDAFCLHAKLNPTLHDFIKALLHLTTQALQGLEEEWFTYWPDGFSLEGVPYLEFSWIPSTKVLGFQFNPDLHWLEGYRHTSDPAIQEYSTNQAKDAQNQSITLLTQLNTQLNTAVKHFPKPKVVKAVSICANEENHLALQITFKQSISPEPWEEGSSGYKD